MTSDRPCARLLVTGGCGFIGSAFVRHALRQGATVVNLDLLTYAANPKNLAGAPPDRYVFQRGDVADGALVERLVDAHAVDTIVHFAAESHVDRSIRGPLEFVATNVVGTAQLLEVVRRRPHVHLHHVSTDEVFGSLGPTGAFREDTPYDPRSPYAASKAASDHLVRAWAHTYGLGVTISNCSNNYGPYQFPEKLVPLMILRLLAGEPLPVYGDGSNVRDWLHVEDHVEAIWTILQRGERGRTYNVGGGAERTNLALIGLLIDRVAEETGRDRAALEAQITFVADRPGHDRRYAIDSRRIRDELGWVPRHTLDDGLRETVRWYLANEDWVRDVTSGAYRDWVAEHYTQP